MVELPCCVAIIIYGNAAWFTLNISDVDEIRYGHVFFVGT